MMVAPAAYGGAESETGPKTVAYFRLSGAMTETPMEVPPLFAANAPLSLKELLTTLKQARQDPEVAAIVLDLEGAQLGLAQLEEVSAALRQFGAVDKEVFVHADALSTGTYALASAASHIALVPTGEVWLTGLYSEAPYLRGMLDKIGVVPDVEQREDYKSAGEMFTRTGPSPAAEKMLNWLLDSIYDRVVGIIAEGREMKPERVQELIDHGMFSAEEALKAGLIDSVQHRQDFLAELKGRYGADMELAFDYAEESTSAMPEDFFGMMNKLMQMFSPTTKKYTKPSVAIVYVEGMILPGSAEPSPFGSTEGAYSSTIRKALDAAADDDTVKAVVLRVDSGGGSALASEIILDASRRVAAKKPLIASMGNVAGSGGYYVTCGAEHVFADAATITASIGVIAGKLVTTGGWDKLGISWSAHQRGKMAGMMSSAKPWSDAERKMIVRYMDEVYATFKGHVVKARGARLTKPIEEIAGGRVFTGAQALELGLVDKLGGLEDAVKFAADKAKLDGYDIRVIPEPKSIFEMLFNPGGDSDYAHVLSGKHRLLTQPLVQALLPGLQRVDPLRTRAVVRSLQKLELLHDEAVIVAMPEELVIGN